MKKIIFVSLIVCFIFIIAFTVFYLIFPNEASNFIRGLWYGIRAPIVLILNIFGTQFDFYSNTASSNFYNLGFLLGIFAWSSHPPLVIHKIHKRDK